MNASKCTHFRIRDDNAYNIDVEDFIKCIETQYNIDFKSLPEWKELTKRMHVMTTDFKRKLQDSNRRKSLIMRKLFIEFTRPTPFELTETFARTARKWESMKIKTKKRTITLKEDLENVTSNIVEEEFDEVEDFSGTAHPNTAINTPVHTFPTGLWETNANFPTYICKNKHKLISPLVSDDSTLMKPMPVSVGLENKSKNYEWMRFNQNKSIACSPTEIILKFDNLEEQSLKFTLTNCASEFLHVRFKTVTEKGAFRRAKILPPTPVILYPGVPVVYKFVFRLVERKTEFTSQLYFKVGRNVYADTPVEALYIPIFSKFMKARSVSVPEIVSIPPIYFWHIKLMYPKYPSVTVKVSVNDDRCYHLRVVKRALDFTKEFETSVDTIESHTDSLEQEELVKIESEEKTKNKRKWRRNAQKETKAQRDKQAKENEAKAKEREAERLLQIMLEEALRLHKEMASVAKDIVELALNTFMFENTYFYLQPDVQKLIPVYLTKIENTGCHNCYYDFEFIDPETEYVVITKTVRVFADVLPNPVQIQPEILVMSNSHKIYGFCKDHFIITNTHKLLPATVKFNLSSETKKIIRVLPMGTVIPALSCVRFEVKFCSRSQRTASEDLVHFTFEIMVIGHKSVFRNVPPIIYEIIASCVDELRRATNTKYYRDLMSERAMKLV